MKKTNRKSKNSNILFIIFIGVSLVSCANIHKSERTPSSTSNYYPFKREFSKKEAEKFRKQLTRQYGREFDKSYSLGSCTVTHEPLEVAHLMHEIDGKISEPSYHVCMSFIVQDNDIPHYNIARGLVCDNSLYLFFKGNKISNQYKDHKTTFETGTYYPGGRVIGYHEYEGHYIIDDDTAEFKEYKDRQGRDAYFCTNKRSTQSGVGR